MIKGGFSASKKILLRDLLLTAETMLFLNSYERRGNLKEEEIFLIFEIVESTHRYSMQPTLELNNLPRPAYQSYANPFISHSTPIGTSPEIRPNRVV